MAFYTKYGRKEHFVIIRLPTYSWIYSYSAKSLQQELNNLLVGQRIQTIYVSLNSYLESMHNDINVIDCTYMGGMILVIFEKTALNPLNRSGWYR